MRTHPDIPENPVLAGALQSDLVAVEQMSPADLRRLADSLGRYDTVTVVASARLAPLVYSAREGEPFTPAVLNEEF